jgi:Pin2-interacting protein X1
LREVDQEPKMRMGIGASKFGSLMSSTFLASLPTASGIDDLGHPPANKDDSEIAGEAVGTSGQPKEQENPEKAEKKEKRKRDRKGRDKSIERPEPSDDNGVVEHTRPKEKKARHKRCHDAVATTTDKDKEARKRGKAERKVAKKATRRSDA